jgi:hypothetical protein
MSDALHRVLIGQTTTRKQLIAAGIVVIIWILMDVIQFVDWAIQKFHTTCQQ